MELESPIKITPDILTPDEVIHTVFQVFGAKAHVDRISDDSLDMFIEFSIGLNEIWFKVTLHFVHPSENVLETGYLLQSLVQEGQEQVNLFIDPWFKSFWELDKTFREGRLAMLKNRIEGYLNAASSSYSVDAEHGIIPTEAQSAPVQEPEKTPKPNFDRNTTVEQRDGLEIPVLDVATSGTVQNGYEPAGDLRVSPHPTPDSNGAVYRARNFPRVPTVDDPRKPIRSSRKRLFVVLGTSLALALAAAVTRHSTRGNIAAISIANTPPLAPPALPRVIIPNHPSPPTQRAPEPQRTLARLDFTRAHAIIQAGDIQTKENNLLVILERMQHENTALQINSFDARKLARRAHWQQRQAERESLRDQTDSDRYALVTRPGRFSPHVGDFIYIDIFPDRIILKHTVSTTILYQLVYRIRPPVRRHH